MDTRGTKLCASLPRNHLRVDEGVACALDFSDASRLKGLELGPPIPSP